MLAWGDDTTWGEGDVAGPLQRESFAEEDGSGQEGDDGELSPESRGEDTSVSETCLRCGLHPLQAVPTKSLCCLICGCSLDSVAAASVEGAVTAMAAADDEAAGDDVDLSVFRAG